jgi:hypothetical protein
MKLNRFDGGRHLILWPKDFRRAVGIAGYSKPERPDGYGRTDVS